VFNLIGLGISVSRRSALDNIANINLAAAKLDGFDNAREKLTGGTDERFSLPVLFESGALAHKYKLGPGIAFAKYNTGALPGQSATPAIT